MFHAELYGSREGKYDWLEQTSFAAAGWQEVVPRLPLLLFTPLDETLLNEYEQGWKITDIFPVNSVGIVTARDALTIHFTRDEAWRTVRDFAALSEEEARRKYDLGKDSQDWKVTWAQADLKADGPSESKLTPILYRPFDVRWTYYTGKASGFHCRPRGEVMRQMLEVGNLALITSRMTKGETFQHTLVSDSVSEVILLSPKTSNNAFVFPLWLDPSGEQKDLLRDAHTEKRANFAPKFLLEVERKLGGTLQVTPETLFAYLYAVLHSPSYRSRYVEYLKSDFPRVPLTTSRARFEQLAALGENLIALHLLRAPELDKPVASYPVEGSHLVEKLSFVEPEGRVYINPKQYFAGVEQADWDFHIGGYRVLEKWLKDRKGRQLSFDDIVHYQRVVGSVRATRGLMQQIDEAIGTWPLQ